MSLEQSIAELNTNIRDLIAALTTGAPVQAAPVVKAEKPKAEKPKAEPKVEAIEPKVEAQPADEPEPVVTVSEEDCKQITLKLAATKGRDAAVAVLSEFGVSKAGELKADQRAEYHAAAVAALEA